jgi:NAD(P)-dependent dehydrogenase (short-subunit alcohol dehydrogenase family)
MGDINDVVETIFYLSGDAAKYITGQIINVSGGLV